MDEIVKVEEINNDVKNEVVIAYHEVINQLKSMNQALPEEARTKENETVKRNIIETAGKDSAESLAKKIAEFKSSVTKTLDDIKIRLSSEYEKFYTLRQAITISEEELEHFYEIKVNVNTLSALILAQKEKKESFEKEMQERRSAFEAEQYQLEKDRIREQNEYVQKRDMARKREQEQYEIDKRILQQELLETRHALEIEFEAREAALAARENEHQQLKEREARIIAREQEFAQLKDKEARFPEEMRLAVQKAETLLRSQLMRKYEYDIKLSKIEWDSEKTQFLQKIEALEQQIEQYKSLKQLFA